ncbi:hypothetical protein CsSME_00032320 [Camellia sinensis var. sinensis]
MDDEISAKQEQQLEEVRSVLRKVVEEEDSLKGLVMIDALQRLGINYHFREDIENVLHSQYMNSGSHSFTDQHDDLYEVSTRFRLLRQQGYNVPTGWCIYYLWCWHGGSGDGGGGGVVVVLVVEVLMGWWL